MPDKIALDMIGRLMASQPFAALCTSADGWPYCSLVAFASHPDLKTIYFATPQQTHKSSHLTADKRVALLIDNRSNQPTDCFGAVAVTILGIAHILTGDYLPAAREIYLKKHPHLKDFLLAADTLLVGVSVCRYRLVEQFQQTTDVIFQEITSRDF